MIGLINSNKFSIKNISEILKIDIKEIQSYIEKGKLKGFIEKGKNKNIWYCEQKELFEFIKSFSKIDITQIEYEISVKNKMLSQPHYFKNNFARIAQPREISRFLVRYELLKKIKNIKGSIVECGVYSGQGLMTWAHLSNIIEPQSNFRHIYGFDSFEGFPEIHTNDLSKNIDNSKDMEAGNLKDDCYNDLLVNIKYFERFYYNKHAQHHYRNKITLVKGDFLETADDFINTNKHLIISLLFLDFDIYAPTKKALEVFLPKMPKSSIVCFDEINNPICPGETIALLETLNINNLKIEKFDFNPDISYFVV